jgi:predicted transcriptional regulator
MLGSAQYLEGVAPGLSSSAFDRVAERRRAVALARHFREAEGLSIAQIADRLGRSPATVKAYFYDPTGEKARAVNARYVGVPSLSTSGETLTIEESMNLEGENGERRNVGDEHEWSWSCG